MWSRYVYVIVSLPGLAVPLHFSLERVVCVEEFHIYSKRLQSDLI
jgi:hypothetical protein